MRTITAFTFEQLNEIFTATAPSDGAGWCYRGQADNTWLLVPRAGRPEYAWHDLARFKEWRRQAIAYYPELPADDWECLAIAQHYGLATRLLDWTWNPLVATYFAINSEPAVDGAVYCLLAHKLEDVEEKTFEEITHVARYSPRAIHRRILQQAAFFTYHPQPTKSLEHEELLENPGILQVVIPARMKASLLASLNMYGINNVTLFPDLEGLSRHSNWVTQGITRLRGGT